MQELDRIYFQPLFHKKCQFLVKSRKSHPAPGKRGVNKKQKVPLNAKISSAKKFRPCQKLSAEDNANHFNSAKIIESNITLQYIENEPLSQATSCSSMNSQFPSCRKHRKMAKKLLAIKPRFKVSRKLRLWLEKRQIMIIRRKRVNRKFKIQQKQAKKIRPQLLKWR